MKTKEAIDILEKHNKWRRGEPPYDADGIAAHKMPVEPKELGVAIDIAIQILKTVKGAQLIHDDMVLLPREPTKEMLICFGQLSPLNESWFCSLVRQYKAMIKAYEEGK